MSFYDCGINAPLLIFIFRRGQHISVRQSRTRSKILNCHYSFLGFWDLVLSIVIEQDKVMMTVTDDPS